MTIVMDQICDCCGQRRPLPKKPFSNEVNPNNGGWRELSYGNIKATFCNTCISRLVDFARSRKSLRDNQGDVPPLTLVITDFDNG